MCLIDMLVYSFGVLFFSSHLQLKGTKELVETNGHSHEDTNVGTTHLGFPLVSQCWLNAHENVALYYSRESEALSLGGLLKLLCVRVPVVAQRK